MSNIIFINKYENHKMHTILELWQCQLTRLFFMMNALTVVRRSIKSIHHLRKGFMAGLLNNERKKRRIERSSLGLVEKEE